MVNGEFVAKIVAMNGRIRLEDHDELLKVSHVGISLPSQE